jgi:hypothetical protein
MSDIRISMVNPQRVIMHEIASGFPQNSVALTYAFIMRQEGETADWPTINRAIMNRWKGRTSLERVKKMAWKYLEDR